MRPSRFVRESLTLRDGRDVTLRPIDPSDAPLLVKLHDRLSFEAQYYRFFGPKPSLSLAESEYLAKVDFHKRFAVVAEVQENDTPSVVGVGRFDWNQPDMAEVAIVVRDDYQGAGLGTAILTRLREIGRGAGIQTFYAEILAENAKMLELLERNGIEVVPGSEGVVRVRTPLDLPLMLRGLKSFAERADQVREHLPKLPRT
jgi:RimJ/RimL family protein N-acetyltransferase